MTPKTFTHEEWLAAVKEMVVTAAKFELGMISKNEAGKAMMTIAQMVTDSCPELEKEMTALAETHA
jgi:hypothetical protein